MLVTGRPFSIIHSSLYSPVFFNFNSNSPPEEDDEFFFANGSSYSIRDESKDVMRQETFSQFKHISFSPLFIFCCCLSLSWSKNDIPPPPPATGLWFSVDLLDTEEESASINRLGVSTKNSTLFHLSHTSGLFQRLVLERHLQLFLQRDCRRRRLVTWCRFGWITWSCIIEISCAEFLGCCTANPETASLA